MNELSFFQKSPEFVRYPIMTRNKVDFFITGATGTSKGAHLRGALNLRSRLYRRKRPRAVPETSQEERVYVHGPGALRRQGRKAPAAVWHQRHPGLVLRQRVGRGGRFPGRRGAVHGILYLMPTLVMLAEAGHDCAGRCGRSGVRPGYIEGAQEKVPSDGNAARAHPYRKRAPPSLYVASHLMC